MQVSSQTGANYSPIDISQNRPDKVQDLSQEERDTLRQTAALKAGKESTEAQIEAYIAGTQQYNETSSEYSSNEDYVQNYTDFASDVRQANNYASLVENGVDLSTVIDRGTIQPLPNPSELNQDQKDTLREGIVSAAGYQSTQDQIEAYKAGLEQSNTSFDETAQYVENYNEFAAEARRSESLNTYIDYNNYLAG